MTIVLQSVIFIIRSIFIANEKSSLFKPDLNKAVKFFRVRENLILAHGKVGQWMNFQVAMRFCEDKPQDWVLRLLGRRTARRLFSFSKWSLPR